MVQGRDEEHFTAKEFFGEYLNDDGKGFYNEHEADEGKYSY